jgi:hypothetical protein
LLKSNSSVLCLPAGRRHREPRPTAVCSCTTTSLAHCFSISRNYILEWSEERSVETVDFDKPMSSFRTIGCILYRRQRKAPFVAIQEMYVRSESIHVHCYIL